MDYGGVPSVVSESCSAAVDRCSVQSGGIEAEEVSRLDRVEEGEIWRQHTHTAYLTFIL